VAWRNLEPGRLYDITWVDIQESPADSPKDGKIATYVNSYRFYARRYLRVGSKRVPYLVFTSGQGTDPYHYCAFPEGCIVDIQPAR
jgi:hypothetical protein